MFFKGLETERLFLKVIDMSDAEFMLKQFSNDKVNRYLFDEEPFSSIEEAKGLIDFYMEAEPRNQNRWILIRKEDGEKIGTCGFHCWDRELHKCELGYDLYPDYRKKGYMGEALPVILSFAENEMEIKTMEAHIAVRNMDSIRTAEKQGFIDSSKTYNEIFRGKEYLHYIYIRSFR